MNIAIVDDDKAYRDLFVDAAEDAGHTVKPHDNFQSALDALRSNAGEGLELWFLDCSLVIEDPRNFSGVTLAREICKLRGRSTVALVMYSKHAFPGTRVCEPLELLLAEFGIGCCSTPQSHGVVLNRNLRDCVIEADAARLLAKGIQRWIEWKSTLRS